MPWLMPPDIILNVLILLCLFNEKQLFVFVLLTVIVSVLYNHCITDWCFEQKYILLQSVGPVLVHVRYTELLYRMTVSSEV